MVSNQQSSGSPHLDTTIQKLRLGDNVVWQVDQLADYAHFAHAFATQAIADGLPCVYIRFASHEALLDERPGLSIIAVNPSSGFDVFSAQIHHLIGRLGRRVAYVFDNLSYLVEPWTTDELLANFFQVTCPYLYELDTIAYFALMRGRHANDAVAKIAATTQVMIDLYQVGDRRYLHPIKAFGRYSPNMFMPHLVEKDAWTPIFELDRAAGQVAPMRAKAMHGEPVVESIAPWDSIYRQLLQSRESGLINEASGTETESLKRELRRMLIGDEPHFARLADRYLTVDDLLAIRERLIGSGRIGGKAAGMYLARRILCQAPNEDGIAFDHVLEDHDSFYVGSDVFFTFLVSNRLFRRRLQVQQTANLSPEQYAEIEALFQSGTFPDTIMARFREMLAHYGETPIIVRSSSLYEDGFGHAFAGKYRSEFCANQGDIESRLAAFVRAVKRVYASALSPDALAYRRKQGLIDSDEQMAILVQRVSGHRYHDYYYPPVAGVAFSRNIYPWADRIDPLKGMARLVYGLGTRAVDRVDDYPRVIALSHPHLRPQLGEEIVRYSQRSIDVIDLAENALRTAPLGDVVESDYPNLDFYASQLSQGDVYDAVTNLIDGSFRDQTLVLTLNKFLQRTQFVELLRSMVQTLERVYGHPIDIEFTVLPERGADIRINLVQCRPMSLPGWSPRAVPAQIAPERVLFKANRMAGGGMVRDIAYIVYVNPVAYAALGSDGAQQSAIARLVGRLNNHPKIVAGKAIMMGPGRWGSSNTALGVGVSYADIDNAAVLVEVAREDRGYLPEVSFGTHFFQDLVENQIIYMPLYPDDPASRYREAFFAEAPNALAALLPNDARMGDHVRVIDIAAAADGLMAQVVANPSAHEAICFLAEPGTSPLPV